MIRKLVVAVAIVLGLLASPTVAVATSRPWGDYARPTMENGGLPYDSFLRQRPDGSWERCWRYRNPERLVCQPNGSQNWGYMIRWDGWGRAYLAGLWWVP